MIRTGRRLGIVNAGDGGNAGLYQFNDGLSSDPALAPYLQDLTPAQLQAALDGKSPSITDMIGTSPLTLTTCQQNYDPAICGPGGPNSTNPLAMSLGLSSNSIFGAVPTWALFAGVAVLGVALFGGRR